MLPSDREAARPRGVVGAVVARERPGAMPIPHDRSVSALTSQSVLDRWTEDAAAIRPVSALAIGDGVITMFDIIGEDYWSGGGITAKSVASALIAIGDKPVEIQINSPGGDMFEGIAIYNVLREHPQEITVKIMGMAASAASVIAMAGDRIEIGAASFMMIHNCWVVAIGNRHDMQATSEWLAPFDAAMVELYAMRSGADAKAIEGWMDAGNGDGTYMSGSVAIERGFADALLAADAVSTDKKAKTNAKSVNDLRAMEMTLVAGGQSRTQARASINRIKSTPGAAVEDTPGAVDPELLGPLAGLLATIQS